MGKTRKLTGVPRKRPQMSGEEFRRIRVEVLGWTQEKLALELGVTPLHLIRWENNQGRILPQHVKHLNRIVLLERMKPKQTEEAVAATAR
jgi:transcriptional regulator with XRE-family HTH domain